jgi:uncharacterized repeat protein (TIGR03847 family)
VAAPEFRHPAPDRFVVGTVGEPGQRTFYLQARSGSVLTSVVVEKSQVSLLADRLDELLDSVVRRAGETTTVPSATPQKVDDLAPLELPLEEEFRAGTLALAWIGETEQVEIIASESLEDDDTAPSLVVHLTGAQARSFVARARAVISAGRPPCPLCAQPLDPQGHICPRQNGYHRRS